MKQVPLRMREQIVNYYHQKPTRTYAQTAAVFGVGVATVSRLLSKARKGKSLQADLSRCGRKQSVQLSWLKTEVEKHPDARLVDRIEAYQAHSGIRVCKSTMSLAMKRLGYSYKKKHP